MDERPLAWRHPMADLTAGSTITEGHTLLELTTLAACARAISACGGDAAAFDESRRALGALLLASKLVSDGIRRCPEFQEAMRAINASPIARCRLQRWHGSPTPWLLSNGTPTSLEVTVEFHNGEELVFITLQHVADRKLCLGSSSDPAFQPKFPPGAPDRELVEVRIKDAINCVEIVLDFQSSDDHSDDCWHLHPASETCVWHLNIVRDERLGAVVYMDRDYVLCRDDVEEVQVLAGLSDWTSLTEPASNAVRPPALDALRERLNDRQPRVGV